MSKMINRAQASDEEVNRTRYEKTDPQAYIRQKPPNLENED